MKKKTCAVRALGLALLVALSLPAMLTAEGVSLKPELKKEVQSTYKRLQKDPGYLAIRNSLKGNMLNRAVVDRYLTYLPISPLEIFELDRWARRSLMATPDFIEAYHERWKQLHPAAARRFYGAERGRRADGSPTAEEKLLSDGSGDKLLLEGTEKKTEVDTNRNMAHDFAVLPLNWQSEVQVVVNPNNPNQLVAASNTAKIPGACGPRTIQAIYYSSDGGTTWGFTCAPNPIEYGLDCGAIGGILNGSDPTLAWNTNNEVFFNYMAICNNGIPRTAMLLARSADGGVTWNAQGIIKNSWPTEDFEDKELLAIDNNAGSPYFGRLYSCWGRNSDEKIAFSSNNGVTWTERDLPAPPNGGYDVSCDIAVQKDGTVNVVWETETCDDFACYDEWIYHTRSTDGGNTWSAPNLVADLNFAAFSDDACPDAESDRCIISMGSLDVDNTGGACNGSLYVTYADKPAGGTANNMDVFVKRSADGGLTWGPAVRVNDDGAGGKVQFFPFLSVDPIKGQPVAAWYDARNDPANTAVDIFASRSVNCGTSFKKNVQVTKPSTEFNNSTISSSNESAVNVNHNVNQYGDYIGIDARNGRAFIAWTDSRHFFPNFTTEAQKENIGFAVVTFGPPAPDPVDCAIVSQRAQLTWKDNAKATDVASYNVYRVSGGLYTKVGSLSVSGFSLTATRTFKDTATSLATAKASLYAIAGVDSLGEEGPYSTPVAPK